MIVYNIVDIRYDMIDIKLWYLCIYFINILIIIKSMNSLKFIFKI